MMDFSTMSTELLTSFNDITYHDVPHKYYYGDEQFVSVTTILHKYQEPFDEAYWLSKKSEEFGIPEYLIKRCWNFINKKGTMKGSIIHDYAENMLLNKVFFYPKDDIISEFGFDPIKLEYDKTKRHVDNFIKVSKGRLIPVKTELVMYDLETKIAGMADLIFYNVRDKEFQIWDWKTNKKFSYDNRFQNLNGILGTLEDCDLEMYSLQLEAYKYILEKNTNIKFGKSHLVWVSHNNDNFQIIPTHDRRYFIETLFNERKQSLAA